MTLIEAAEYVYTAWMGGTMNDVRDGMNNLGEVLEAIKNEPVLPGIEQEADKVAWRDYVPVDAVDASERYGKWKIVPIEPASEDLECAIKFYTASILLNGVASEATVKQLREVAYKCFKAGANWQREHILETLCTEYEKGYNDMREKMMKEMPKWKKTTNPHACWSGEIGVNPIGRTFTYENYTINADKLFKLLPKEK